MTSSLKECEVCRGAAHPLARLCKRCKRLVDRVEIRSKPDKEARIRALKQAWSGKAFQCYYTGAVLVDDNHHDPRYVTFDHRTPRKEDDIVVAAAVINDMKSDMTEHEFKALVVQLAKRFDGGPFDENVLRLNLWKR